MKKLTFKDIKELSGLSLGTISRYFNNGAISTKSRSILDKIVSEHNYIPNTAAQNLKAKPKDIYVLMSSTSSHSNYLISSGIITNYKDVITVFYENNFNSFKEKFLWVLGTSHIGIIVFPPFNENDNVCSLIQNYYQENIVIYDLPILNFGSVKYCVQNSLQDIAKLETNKLLDYVYINKQDHNFDLNIKQIKSIFKKVEIINIEEYNHQLKNLTLFQYNDLLEKYHKFNWDNLIMISKDYNWKIMPKYWIEIDFKQIGYQLIKLVLEQSKQQITTESKLHINYYKTIYNKYQI